MNSGRFVEGTGPEVISDAIMEVSCRSCDRPRQRNARRSSAEISTTFWADGLACRSDPIWQNTKRCLALGFAANFEYLLSRNAVLCGLDWCAEIIVMCMRARACVYAATVVAGASNP